ncbi:hypothetical protein EDB19DRAFT_1290395 [Suillus lakei]|nr:hypothetical protein EDB19DRAFT_1290395 [Suillus lakei]
MDIAQAEQMSMSFYTMLVPNIILLYDHMATLTEEIDFIWCRPKALSAVLFLLNRYVALFGNIYGLVGVFLPYSVEVPSSHYTCTRMACSRLISAEVRFWFLNICSFAQQRLSCPTYTLSKQVLVFLQVFIVCVILTLRTYALYGRDKRLLALLVIIILAFFGGAAAETFGRYPSIVINLPGEGCYQVYTTEINIRLGITWVALSGYELLIFVLTVSRIFKIRGLLRFSLVMPRRNIIVVMFQDGAMYFVAMTLFNVPNILTYYCGSDTTRGTLSTFTSCMSVTLISAADA